MQDRPGEGELLEATAHFLSEEIAPLVADNPRLRFRLLIAINVLNIVMRELKDSDPLLQAEWQRLTALSGQTEASPPCHPQELEAAIQSYNQELCARIRQGEADQEQSGWTEQLVAHLEATVAEKLQIANPRFLQQ